MKFFCFGIPVSFQLKKTSPLSRSNSNTLLMPPEGQLSLATKAATYRQKMQRSFAAELLSPFEPVDEMLDGDYSDEQQQDVAQHFHVSPLTIRTLLVNNRRIERDGFDDIENDQPIFTAL